MDLKGLIDSRSLVLVSFKLYRRTSASREYVRPEFNCRRIFLIVHHSTSDKLAVDSVVLLVCGLAYPPKERERVSGRERVTPILGLCRAVHSGGAKGAVAPARKTKCFFSNIVSDFAGLFLVAILVRNLTKTEFAPADKKS